MRRLGSAGLSWGYWQYMVLLPRVLETRECELRAQGLSSFWSVDSGEWLTDGLTRRTYPTKEDLQMAESALRGVREDLAKRGKDMPNPQATMVRIQLLSAVSRLSMLTTAQLVLL